MDFYPILEPWQYRQHVVLKYHIKIKQITNNLTGQTVDRIPVFELCSERSQSRLNVSHKLSSIIIFSPTLCVLEILTRRVRGASNPGDTNMNGLLRSGQPAVLL